MRTSVLALLAVACVGLSACGSDDASHDAVPSSLPQLTVPQGSSALAKPAGTSTTGAGSSSSGSSTTPDQTSSTATGTTGTTPQSTGQGTSTQTGTTGGTGAGTGGTGTSGQTTTTDGTGGAAPGEFNQFCQDNPGACPGN
jgi:hypothetical protein